MTAQSATAHNVEDARSHFFAIFVSKDTYATRERAGLFSHVKSGKFSYISKFHIIISCKLIVYIVMCFYQETN